MILRVKAANNNEFNAACSDGGAYGRVRGRSGLYVYADLGQEKEYIPSPKDDPQTEYRMFTGCDAYFADTEQQLRNGDFRAEELHFGHAGSLLVAGVSNSPIIGLRSFFRRVSVLSWFSRK